MRPLSYLPVLFVFVFLFSVKTASSSATNNQPPPKAVKDTVEQIWNKLAYKGKVTVVKDKELNAWTSGHDKIFITDSLYNFCKSNDEVAAVLLHEQGHGECMHFEKMESDDAALSRAIKSATRACPNETGTIKVSGKIIRAGQMIFSKSLEFEADGWAYGELARKGYDSEAFVQLFSRLVKELGDNGGLLGMLSTHPPFSERIEKLQDLGLKSSVYDRLIQTVETVDMQPFVDIVSGKGLPGYQICPIGKAKYGVYLIYKSSITPKVKKGTLTLGSDVRELVVLCNFVIPEKRQANSFWFFLGENGGICVSENIAPFAFRINASDLGYFHEISYCLEYKQTSFFSIYRPLKSELKVVVDKTPVSEIKEWIRPKEFAGIGKPEIINPIKRTISPATTYPKK